MNDGALPAKSALIDINGKNLWRLETIGDLESAEIQIYHPVTEDGAPDPSRDVKFCSLMDISYRGARVKLRFDIPAKTLPEALANFHEAGEKFGFETLDKLESERMRAMLATGGTIDGKPS